MNIPVPDTGRDGDNRSFKEVKAPVLLHVVFEDQVPCHGDLDCVRSQLGLVGHQERIVRCVGPDHLPLYTHRQTEVSQAPVCCFSELFFCSLSF